MPRSTMLAAPATIGVLLLVGRTPPICPSTAAVRACTAVTARTVLVSVASRTDSTILTIFDYFLPCFFPMPLYLYLPVYKASYDLLLELFRFAKDFNREYKYTLGESIKKEIVEIKRGQGRFKNLTQQL